MKVLPTPTVLSTGRSPPMPCARPRLAEPEPHPLLGARQTRVQLHEGLEDALERVGGDAASRISHRHEHTRLGLRFPRPLYPLAPHLEVAVHASARGCG